MWSRVLRWLLFDSNRKRRQNSVFVSLKRESALFFPHEEKYVYKQRKGHQALPPPHSAQCELMGENNAVKSTWPECPGLPAPPTGWDLSLGHVRTCREPRPQERKGTASTQSEAVWSFPRPISPEISSASAVFLSQNPWVASDKRRPNPSPPPPLPHSSRLQGNSSLHSTLVLEGVRKQLMEMTRKKL